MTLVIILNGNSCSSTVRYFVVRNCLWILRNYTFLFGISRGWIIKSLRYHRINPFQPDRYSKYWTTLWKTSQYSGSFMFCKAISSTIKPFAITWFSVSRYFRCRTFSYNICVQKYRIYNFSSSINMLQWKLFHFLQMYFIL